MSIIKTSEGMIIEDDLDFTEYMFEFPVYISILRDDKDKQRLRDLGLEVSEDDEEESEPVVGMIAFPHEMISGYGDWMKEGRDLDDVKSYGFDATEVYVRGEMQSYFSPWKREVFKQKLNEHVRNLRKKRSLDVENQWSAYVKSQSSLLQEVATKKKKGNWFSSLFKKEK